MITWLGKAVVLMGAVFVVAIIVFYTLVYFLKRIFGLTIAPDSLYKKSLNFLLKTFRNR